MRLIITAAGLCCLLWTGCQSLPATFASLDPRNLPEQAAYEEAIEPYLLRMKIYDGPATAAFLTAMPLTAAVRQAQAERQAAAHSLNASQLATLLQNSTAQAGLEIMLGIFTPDSADSKFEHPDTASWRIFLHTEAGEQLEAESIVEIPWRQRNALNQALYPFWGYWDHLFRLRFPLPPSGQTVDIVISGPQGKAQSPLYLN
jgi:hypothetical protein